MEISRETKAAVRPALWGAAARRHQGAEQGRADHGLAVLWVRQRIHSMLYAGKHDLDV